jgi:hypothetical protein
VCDEGVRLGLDKQRAIPHLQVLDESALSGAGRAGKGYRLLRGCHLAMKRRAIEHRLLYEESGGRRVARGVRVTAGSTQMAIEVLGGERDRVDRCGSTKRGTGIRSIDEMQQQRARLMHMCLCVLWREGGTLVGSQGESAGVDFRKKTNIFLPIQRLRSSRLHW